jgi:hypothetical protein
MRINQLGASSTHLLCVPHPNPTHPHPQVLIPDVQKLINQLGAVNTDLFASRHVRPPTSVLLLPLRASGAGIYGALYCLSDVQVGGSFQMMNTGMGGVGWGGAGRGGAGRGGAGRGGVGWGGVGWGPVHKAGCALLHRRCACGHLNVTRAARGVARPCRLYQPLAPAGRGALLGRVGCRGERPEARRPQWVAATAVTASPSLDLTHLTPPHPTSPHPP